MLDHILVDLAIMQQYGQYMHITVTPTRPFFSFAASARLIAPIKF